MWAQGFTATVQSLVMVPIVLYQAEQILCGQIAVILFRRWARDEWMPKEVSSDEEIVADEIERSADVEINQSEATLPSSNEQEKLKE